MARKLGIGCVGVIANKVLNTVQAEVIRSHLSDAVLLGIIGYSRSLQEADLNRMPVFEADNGVTEELRQVKDKLAEIILQLRSGNDRVNAEITNIEKGYD